MRILIISFALHTATVPQLALSQRISGTVMVDSCLPPSEFQLRGITLTSQSSVALEGLGKPLRVTTDSGEDDGGRYEVKTYHYRDLEFDDVRGFVDRVATHSRTVVTPSGLRPGLGLQALRELLMSQGVRMRASADTLDIPSCGIPDASMLLVLDRTNHVRVLVMAAARP